MTDSDSTGDSEIGSGSSTESKPNWRRDLENRAKEAEEKAATLELELSSIQRRDTFRSAGLDLDDARTKYFVKGYEGELDVEAIRQEATMAGFLGAADAAPIANSVFNDMLSAEQRIQAAGEGGDPVLPPDLDSQIRATTDQDELRTLLESNGILWGAAT
jgi:ribosomal protein L12E/L44/L45/RPP1/RPP2